MSASVVETTCKQCSKPFNVRVWEQKQGKGIYCSRLCADKSKRKAVQQKARPAGITPKALDRLPLDDTGGAVCCARCERMRERGQRCSCERREP